MISGQCEIYIYVFDFFPSHTNTTQLGFVLGWNEPSLARTLASSLLLHTVFS